MSKALIETLPREIKFGLNLLSQNDASKSQSAAFQDLLEQAVLADELGFDSLFVNEHHPFEFEGQYWLKPLVTLAALATRVSRASLGTNILILPLYNPVHVAEDVGMLHAITEGRLILGVAIGFLEKECEAFGVTFKKRVSRFREQIDIIRSLWRDKSVTYLGNHFRIENIALPLPSAHAQAPPIWIGAEIERSIVRAAEIGDAWLPADTSSITLLERAYAVYVRALVADGLGNPERPLMRETYVGETSRGAREAMAKYVLEKYQEYWRLGAPQLRGEFPNGDLSFDALAPERFIVGDPGECVEQVLEHHARLGITHFIFRVQKKGMPQGEAVEVIRRLAAEVIEPCRRVLNRADSKDAKDATGSMP